MKEENSISENAVSLEVHQTEATNKREKRILGIATCIIGVVLLIAWGIVSVFMPSASEQIGTSSMITIDGNGIFLLICLVAIIAGAVLLLKSAQFSLFLFLHFVRRRFSILILSRARKICNLLAM